MKTSTVKTFAAAINTAIDFYFDNPLKAHEFQLLLEKVLLEGGDKAAIHANHLNNASLFKAADLADDLGSELCA